MTVHPVCSPRHAHHRWCGAIIDASVAIRVHQQSGANAAGGIRADPFRPIATAMNLDEEKFYESIRVRELPQFPGEYEYVCYPIHQLCSKLANLKARGSTTTAATPDGGAMQE